METICSLPQIPLSLIIRMWSQELSIVLHGMYTHVSYIPALNSCSLGEVLQSSMIESSGHGILDFGRSYTSWSCSTKIDLGS